MPKTREKKWKKELGKILGELRKDQYKRFLHCLTKIPQRLKEETPIEDMPQIINELYGLEKSISAVQKALSQIPRNDAAVQDLLKPFVQDKENNKKEMKRKRQAKPTMKEEKPLTDQLQICQSEKENQLQPWRQTIQDLLINGQKEKKSIAGLVVQKSPLRTYKTKEKVQKWYFYLGVADDTDAIKVVVYQKHMHREIQEGSVVSFKDVLKDGDVLKVTCHSKVSKTTSLVVPQELKFKAQLLVNPQKPVFVIANIPGIPDKTAVSVEGTVTEIGSVEEVCMRAQRAKKDAQDFTLRDDSSSIRIRLWGNDTLHLRGISLGDFVRVINVKSNHYNNTVSLNSTNTTKIFKVQGAAAQNVTIDIFAIRTCNAMETHLDVYLNDEVETFVVDSAHLTEALGIRVKQDLAEALLAKMPFQAQVELQKGKINRIKLT